MPIIEIDYSAITIDTSIFDNSGIALEKGLLNQLDQFKGGPVHVLISEIVDNEVTAHLSEKIKEARGKINQALRAAENQLRVTGKNCSDAKALIFDTGDDADVAKARLKDFYDKTGAFVLECDGLVDVSKMVGMYFGCEAPFEAGSEKKNEFPDALALLSLETWAENNDMRILAISSDKGWGRYANTSARIDVLDNLADAISHFQPHNFAKNIIDAIKDNYVNGVVDDVSNAIKEGIIDSLDGIDIQIEASSAYYYEENDVHAIYGSHELHCDSSGNPEVNIIRVEGELLVLQVTAFVACEVYASFGLSVWDSIDKEYVGLTSTDRSVEEQYSTEILVYLSGDFSKGLESINADEVEVIDVPSHVEFGEIEPDWGHDEE